MRDFENRHGVRFTSVKWYQDWSVPFDSSAAATLRNYGTLPELTWQPMVNGVGIPDTDVTAGKYDAYLTTFAQNVKAFGMPLRINLAPEVNGDWTPWGSFKFSNTNETHKAMYRYVVRTFQDVGATNVQWIWAPNVRVGNQKYSYAQLYPGDQYVQFIGLDGYNWGRSQSWSQWQSFRELFDTSYHEITRVSTRPLLIMETASTEVGGSKTQWITDMARDLQYRYPRIQGFYWFNMDKETDWRIESSTTSQQAFIKAFGLTTPTKQRPRLRTRNSH